MLFYYPKHFVENAPKGFNLLPIAPSEEDEGKYRADLSLTPFYNYEKEVIRISDGRYIDKSQTVELVSFLLLRYDKSWLTISSSEGGKYTEQAGLLDNYVNRGEEQRIYSYNFNQIKTGITEANQPIAVIGYIITDDKVIFVNRFDFPKQPSFISKSQIKTFNAVSHEELFSPKVYDSPAMGEVSRFVISSMADVITANF